MENKLGESLRNRIQSAQDYDTFDVNIFLKGEPAAERLEALSLRGDAADDEGIDSVRAVAEIKAECASQQKDLLDFLGDKRGQPESVADDVSISQVGEIEAFWVTNAVGTEVTLEVLQSILDRPDVTHVDLSRHVDVEELLDAKKETAKRKRGKRAKSPSGADAVSPTWSVKRVSAPILWRLGLRGKKVTVAVIDTGVNYNHPDLASHMWNGGAAFPNHGYDFDDNDNDPMDQQGHGTACAGIVAGNGTAGSNTGIAPQAKIMALRAGGNERAFWKAFQFAMDHKADVISMSMSWKYPWNPDYPGWRRACESLLAGGVVHANSIGNQGDQLAQYPIPYNIATPGNCPPPRIHPLQSPIGGLSSAIACGATDDSDSLAYYSGRGPAAWEISPYTDYPYNSGGRPGLIKPEVCAPGPGTTSCNWQYSGSGGNPYRSFGGTSAATPHVGGCLALLVEACKRAGRPVVPARLQQALEDTAVRITGQSLDKENHFGAGRVDVYAAYKYGEQRNWW